MSVRSVRRLVLVGVGLTVLPLSAQQQPRTYSRVDTLRGAWDTPGRNWWDVQVNDDLARINFPCTALPRLILSGPLPLPE